MSKLIINEHPLLVLPSLATAIGLNEAIILQQVHYWIDPRINKNYINNVYWVYNTYAQWAKQFPFWSEITIRRTIKNLENRNLLISADLNKNHYSKQKWYTINYKELEKVENSITCTTKKELPDQIDHIDRSNRSHQPIKLIRSYNVTETSTDITTNNSLSLKAKMASNPPKQSTVVKTIVNERENEMLRIWNEVVEKNNIEIKLTSKRSNLLAQRLKEFFNNDISQWKEFCKKIVSSKFLMGEITNFKVSLDWALKEDSLLKIIENNYGIGDRAIAQENNVVDNPELEEEINDPIWKNTREELKKQLGEGAFKSWISKLNFQAISDNIANFIAPTKFIKDWIITNYSNEIKQNFISCGASIQGIFIQVVENK